MPMDAISLEKSSSKKKKREQFTINHLEIERSHIPISASGLYNSSTSSRSSASSETRFEIALDVKKASYDVTEDATNFSKNSYKHVSSSSKNSSSIQALYPSPRPSAKPPMYLETSSGKALSNKKKMDSFTQDDANLTNLSSSSAGLISRLSPNPEPSISSETTPGQASDNKKKGDSVYGDRINSTKNLYSSLGSYPSPCPGHSSEASTSTIITSCMKPIDAKTSDGSTTTSQISCNSPQSDSLDSSSSTTAPIKRHSGHDSRWESIQLASSRDPPLGLGHFKLLKRLGYGDIGSVYLVELKGTGTYFAMKVMDIASIISRNKLIRAQTEREILSLLDHPFLPTLYSHFDTDKFYCLVMEYCSGGNLYSLRQKQPNKYFTEQAARFYASEVLLALEYLHMLGIVYRDLKPENVLVTEEGHIILSDFDLSLRCSVNPTLVKSSSVQGGSSDDLEGMLDSDRTLQGCIQPTTFLPRIIPKKNRKSKSDFGLGVGALPELMAEPTNARSMSFVGTHEYLAPEIIRGEGHGSAVDWWTLGIFIYELIYGTTPFKGSGNRATLFNVVGQPLRFPEEPAVSSSARDLIRGLLVKEPQKRIAYRRGATEIKQHFFFEGVNWALVRSMQPPHVPEPVDLGHVASKDVIGRKKKGNVENGEAKSKQNQSSHHNFEYF